MGNNLLVWMLSVSLCFVATPVASQGLSQIEKEQQALFDKVAPSVVYISSKKSFGSGIFVSDTLVLTNSHVVPRQKTVELGMRGGEKVVGTVIARNDEYDLALVRSSKVGKPVQLAPSSNVRVGSWAAAIGHGAGGIWTFTVGMISNIYTGSSSVIQTQIPINPGNSGGPIINRKGDVVGIATLKSTSDENLNFAIPVEIAVSELKELRQECTNCLRVETFPDAQVFLDGRLIGTGPQVVPVGTGQHQLLVVINQRPKSISFESPKTRRIEAK